MESYLGGASDAPLFPERTGSRAVEIRSHLPDGEPLSGLICVCPDCDGKVFCLWQVDGEKGLHLQCVHCSQVYCCGHDCASEAAEDAALREMGGGG